MQNFFLPIDFFINSLILSNADRPMFKLPFWPKGILFVMKILLNIRSFFATNLHKTFGNPVNF